MHYDPKLSHFDFDMERGRNGELFIDQICTILANKSAEIECKTDHRFIETGRFYIELECRGRDGNWYKSGLNTTKARIWGLVLGKQKPNKQLPAVFFIETNWLRQAVILAEAAGNKAECKYGENPTRGVCVSIPWIQKSSP